VYLVVTPKLLADSGHALSTYLEAAPMAPLLSYFASIVPKAARKWGRYFDFLRPCRRTFVCAFLWA